MEIFLRIFKYIFELDIIFHGDTFILTAIIIIDFFYTLEIELKKNLLQKKNVKTFSYNI